MEKIILFLFLTTFLLSNFGWGNSFPEYDTNPFSFSVVESIAGYGDDIFVVDLNGDSLLDYAFRSETALYTYAHDGSSLWNVAISYPDTNIINYGSKFGAADIDNDGQVEIVALNNSNQVIIFNGLNGNQEGTINISVGANQKAGHVAIANIRGEGDRDIIVQTMHNSSSNPGYYINRTLIAIRMDTQTVIWRVEQDADIEDGSFPSVYEGYWGQAHGSFLCADVDNDGKDEVIGGNMVESDGTVISLGYNTNWVGVNPIDEFVDHLDAIGVGDIRPDLTGIEWAVAEEDHYGQTDYHTTLLSKGGLTWRKETTLFTLERDKEPQNIAVGNFDTTRIYNEVLCSSRLGNATVSQHPWIFDYAGNQIADYATEDVLPPGFNTFENGNKEGLEMMWTIDWFGSKKEHIAAKARHISGNVGVFDAVTGQAIWTTIGDSVEASAIYVADVAGDSREEVIIYDKKDGKIKVYWNEEDNPNQPKPDKWDDPLYVRIKQNWNYYFLGGYTYGDYPLISNISVTNITSNSATISWDTDVLSDSQVEYGETDSYGSETEQDETLTTSHSVQITGLTGNTQYHFRVKSRNAYDKLGMSRDNTDLITSELDPPDITDIVIDGSDNLKLTWTAVSDATGYNVYRDTTAYFVPDKTGGTNRIVTGITDEDTGTDGVQWTDTDDVIGDPETNYFYVVTSIDGTNESDNSNRVGEFDFQLVTTSGTNNNYIALPIEEEGLAMASDLAERIGVCDLVSKWVDSAQGWISYVPGLSFTDFVISAGKPYMVSVTADAVWTMVGSISDSVSFDLATTSGTNNNAIMLPLSKSDLTMASDLSTDIGVCDLVSKWVDSAQGWVSYVPGLSFTDFAIEVGCTYMVSVTENKTWGE